MQMAEIALLADFDAVSVSTYQLDRLEWNVARYAPQDVPPKAVLLRAEQAQHPRHMSSDASRRTRKTGAGNDLVCADDDFFESKISRASRRMIQGILSEGLESLAQAMAVIEMAVVEEVDSHLELRGFLKPSLSKSRRAGGTPKQERQSSPAVGMTTDVVERGGASTAQERSHLPPEEAVQDEDEVF